MVKRARARPADKQGLARFTDRDIAALKHSGRTDKHGLLQSDHHYDTKVPGLGVRVYPSGAKGFFFDWREPGGKQRRRVFGRPPAWTVAKARDYAGRLRRKLDVGETIAPQRGGRIADLADQWREVVILTKRPSTAKSYLRLLNTHIIPKFGKLEPRALTTNVIELWHGTIAEATPYEANRALATLSAFASWLKRDRLIDRNPCSEIKRRPESERQVYLTESEMHAAHVALDAAANRGAALTLRLCLLSGCRIGEALGIRREQIYDDGKRRLWIKPGSGTKNKRDHVAPLSVAASAVAQELVALG